MMTYCYYCDQRCKYQNSKSWDCSACNVTFIDDTAGALQTIFFKRVVNNKNYELEINLLNNTTTLYDWFEEDLPHYNWNDKFNYRRNILTIPQAIKVTPNNIVNKIKYLLVFQ